MKIITFVLIVAAVALGAGCGSTKKSAEVRPAGKPAKVDVPADSLDPALDALDPDFVAMQTGDSYYLGMVAAAGGDPDSPAMEALRSIRWVTFAIYSPDEKLLTSQSTNDIVMSGTPGNVRGRTEPGVGGSVTASAGFDWTPTGEVMPGTYVLMTVRSPSGIIMRRAPVLDGTAAKTPVKPLRLTLESRKRGIGVEFVFGVERVGPAPPGEYIPSGEQYRIEITGHSGETVWESTRGKMNTQAIGSVRPAEVGRKVEYIEYWDGRSKTTRTRLEPGRYRIMAVVPAKPEPYVLREEFIWSGN